MNEGTTSSGSPARPRRQAVLWTGVGVLVAGLGVLGWAVVLAEGVYPTVADEEYFRPEAVEQYRPGLALGLAAVCAVPALATTAWVLVAWRGAVGRSRTFPRPRLVPVCVLLVAAGIGAGYHAVQAGEAPFPGDRALLVASAYGVVLVGTVAVQVAGTRLWSSGAAPGPWSRTDVEALLGGVLAVAIAAGTVVTTAGEAGRIDATTGAAAEATAPPADPTRVRWRWSGGRIVDAVAAGAGVVVATWRGVVALDGRTGEERWRYHRDGMRVALDLVAVDGGRTVVASFDGRVHVFDAFTGELRRRDDETTARTPPPWRAGIVATGSTVVRHRNRPPHVVGTDARTGDVEWQYRPSPECEPTDAHAVGDTVIVRGECTDHYELAALDGASGELLWSRSEAQRVDARAGMVLLPDTGLRIDPRTGEESVSGPDTSVLAYDSTELITNSGTLYESGTARPRWQLPGFSPLVGDRAVTGAALLDDVAVLVEQAGPPSRDHSLRLTVVGRTDGVVRRSFEGADLPTERNFRPIVLPAPGALVVGGSDELVAVG